MTTGTTANYWTLVYENIHSGQIVTFSNVRAKNDVHARNWCEANLALRNHWVLKSWVNSAEPIRIGAPCSPAAGR